MLKYIPKKKILLLVGDTSAIILSFFLAPMVRFGVIFIDFESPWRLVQILILYLFCFYIADLYNFDVSFKYLGYLFRYIASILIATGIAILCFFFFPRLGLGSGIFAIYVVSVAILAYLWRLLFMALFKRRLKRPKKTVIIGAGKEGIDLYKAIEANPAYRIVGFIDGSTAKPDASDPVCVLGDYSILEDIVSKEKIERIIMAVRDIKDEELFRQLLTLKMKGIEIYNAPSFCEETLGRIEVEHLDDAWFVNMPISGVKQGVYNRRIKRIIGIILSLFFLIIGLPIILITALAIKVDSRGSVFYKQKRVGLNGRIFELVKFRSMAVDAENNGAVWANKADSRATRVGKIIRKLRIDEIPQMWNVLVGDMSFFGPRPERPEFVEMLKEKVPYYDLRHAVKPGITGWAQVNYPYGASVEDTLEKLKYDLFYIKNLSPFLDFHILLRTIRVVLFGKGAR